MIKTCIRRKRLLLAVLSIGVVYAAMFALGCTCPIKFIFGVSCPGCGMTRACISALCLKWNDAFYYHPLWVLLVPYFVFLLWLWIKEKKKAARIAAIIGALLMVVVYILRMTMSKGDVVVFEPRNGLIGRSIQYFFDAIST